MRHCCLSGVEASASRSLLEFEFEFEGAVVDAFLDTRKWANSEPEPLLRIESEAEDAEEDW